MRAFNFSLFVVLSCIAKIGATPSAIPTENRASHLEDIQILYVPWWQLVEVLIRFKKYIFPARPLA
jgi:hypothetical protein